MGNTNNQSETQNKWKVDAPLLTVSSLIGSVGMQFSRKLALALKERDHMHNYL